MSVATQFGYEAFGYTSPQPNLVDFISMIRNEIGIQASLVPDTFPAFEASLAYATHWVIRSLQSVDNCLYLRAVYCLASDRLINIAQDPSGTNVFSTIRSNLKITSFTPGVIAASADESTSQSFQVAESLSNLTLPDLQNLKTPWGREYLGYAQQAAPIWGLS